MNRPSNTRRLAVCLGIALALAGCARPAYQLSTRWQSVNQDARITSIVLHYTGADDATSLRLLTQAEHQVSAHYLLPLRPAQTASTAPLPIYQLVPDTARAWHAGASRWQHSVGLNASSIGIEIVNLGYPASDEALPAAERRWQPFPAHQIEALGALLTDLSARYHIHPTALLAHSDIAPQRKQDPGPLFPWRELHQRYGLGAWPDEARVQALLASRLPDWNALTWQRKLARYGYAIALHGQWDEASQAVLRAFELHFNPLDSRGRVRPRTGLPHREAQAILQALLEKYRQEPQLLAG
ncbi:MAG: N-acetylmuramoyl-L-alanine amidase [Aeromonas sp.]